MSSLVAEGPLVVVSATVSAAVEQLLTKDNKPVPTPIPLNFMIDTGATMTVVKTGTAAKLGLQPVGLQKTHTASQKDVECPIYQIRLIFSNGHTVEATVMELPLEGQHIQGLLGRDILAKSILLYSGPTNHFSLSF
jgi:predicted aspartyl protease